MVGELFGKAWELYKRDVWWLILAGFIVAMIFVAAIVVVIIILLAIVRAMGIDTSADSLSSMNATSTGSLIGAAIAVYLVGVTLASIIALVFSGGLYEMVIGAEREGRPAQIGDLFSGFRRIGSYALLWLCQVGAILGIELIVIVSFRYMGPLGLLVGLAGFCAVVWIVVSWVYSIVLVTDRGMGGVEALQESKRMVKSVGWWRTFGALLVLFVLLFVIALVIQMISRGTGGLYATVMAVYYIATFPFSICYIAAMYLGSSPAPARTVRFGVPEPPAHPAAPAGMTYATAGAYQPSAPPARSVGDDAWRAAADPLAAMPAQSLHRPVTRPATPPATPLVASPEPPAPPSPPAPPAPEPPA